MIGVHAELTASGDQIVLVAAGPVEDVTYAAKQLSNLTPLIKPTSPKGGLILPASWPAAVQLAATYGEAWRPGPALQKWIGEQAAVRTRTTPEKLCYRPPAGLHPRPYQVDGALMIARLGRVLITDEPGCLYGDAEIVVNRGGGARRMKLRDLVAKFNGEVSANGRKWDLAIPTYVQRERDGVVRLALLTGAWASGVKTTFTVTTESGRSIRATDEHPFLTERGWLRLDQLQPGDEVHVIGGQAAWNPREPKPRYIEVAGLPAHPWARGVGRRTSRYRVAQHRLVAEADLNGLDYGVFVEKIRAGDVGALEFLSPLIHAVHHRDHNYLNNDLANLEVLTHAEHHRRHASEGKARSVLYKTATERVLSVERYGDEETFDLEVLDEPHNFLANGFVVHNTGKTITTILGLAERAHDEQEGMTRGLPILVVCPASVVDPWVDAFRAWAPTWRTVAWRGPAAKRKALAGTADVYVCSYDTARMDAKNTNPGQSPLVGLDPRSLVADECFPAGTLVDTPHGRRYIETLSVGDEVFGVDHATGEVVVTTVRHTFERRTTESLVEVCGVEMTPNHPVWTARGYAPASAVAPSDKVCHTLIRLRHGDFHADMRVVRADVHERGSAEQAAPVLQRDLLGEMAYVRPGVRRVPRLAEAACGGVGKHASLAREPRGSATAARASHRAEQPAARPGRAGEGTGCLTRAWLPNAEWGEWASDGAAEVAGSSPRMGHGGGDPDRPQVAVSVGVQGRSGLTGTDDRDRGRRGESQESGSARTGREAGQIVDRAGLDRAAVLERLRALRDRIGYRADHGGRRVFNIETGTGNYLVSGGPRDPGLLVHNCHLIKNPHAARTKAVRRLARNAHAFVALSGTPITHHPADLWPTLTCLAPGAWPSRERWVGRYCLVGAADYGENILGLHPGTEPEFRLALLGQQRRVAKADVLDQLPPKVYSVRTVQLPAAYRKAYDQFEADMLADLPDDGGELSVMDVLTKFNFLSALASSAADVEVTFGPEIDEETGEPKRHIHLELKAPSWKIDALLEVLDERPGQPVVTCARSRQLVQLAGAAAAHTGRTVGYVVGGQTAAERTRTISDFQSGNLDLLCVTTGAGGVGITLTAAKTLVFLQRPWSLPEALQMEDRLHRIGSEIHDSIEIVDVVAADTIDTRVRTVLRGKADQLANLVGDPRIVAELLGGATVTRLRPRKVS